MNAFEKYAVNVAQLERAVRLARQSGVLQRAKSHAQRTAAAYTDIQNQVPRRLGRPRPPVKASDVARRTQTKWVNPIKSILASNRISPEQLAKASPRSLDYIRNTRGQIHQGIGGVTRQLGASKNPVSRAAASTLRGKPDAQKLFNLSGARHEMSERAGMLRRPKDTGFSSHHSTVPMLNDLNMAATLKGPGSKEAANAIRMTRRGELEDLAQKLYPNPGNYWEPPTSPDIIKSRADFMQIGQPGRRINRHTRRQIQERYALIGQPEKYLKGRSIPSVKLPWHVKQAPEVFQQPKPDMWRSLLPAQSFEKSAAQVKIARLSRIMEILRRPGLLRKARAGVTGEVAKTTRRKFLKDMGSSAAADALPVAVRTLSPVVDGAIKARAIAGTFPPSSVLNRRQFLRRGGATGTAAAKALVSPIVNLPRNVTGRDVYTRVTDAAKGLERLGIRSSGQTRTLPTIAEIGTAGSVPAALKKVVKNYPLHAVDAVLGPKTTPSPILGRGGVPFASIMAGTAAYKRMLAGKRKAAGVTNMNTIEKYAAKKKLIRALKNHGKYYGGAFGALAVLDLGFENRRNKKKLKALSARAQNRGGS